MEGEGRRWNVAVMEWEYSSERWKVEEGGGERGGRGRKGEN